MVLEKLRDGGSDSALAFDHDVDIEIADMQFDYTPPWEERLRKREITQEELNYALNHFNNVALSVKYLIQVHKPGRNDFSEYEQLIEEKSKEPLKLTSNDL